MDQRPNRPRVKAMITTLEEAFEADLSYDELVRVVQRISGLPRDHAVQLIAFAQGHPDADDVVDPERI